VERWDEASSLHRLEAEDIHYPFCLVSIKQSSQTSNNSVHLLSRKYLTPKLGTQKFDLILMRQGVSTWNWLVLKVDSTNIL
jgi:hypothetical protein